MSEPRIPYRIEPIVVTDESTVVAEFVPDQAREEQYQSEGALERALIDQLKQQAYDHLHITEEADLIANLRRQLEAVNDVQFSDAEWKRFYNEKIASSNAGIIDKTTLIQEDHVQLMQRDDGTFKNIRLIDKERIHNNRLQVINQYEAEGTHSNRYDVTILVNGLPLVHIELKRRGVEIREAFNQIDRYQRESFWSGSGLFDYVQLFVISNGTHTKYYSNTVRGGHLEEVRRKSGKLKSSNSFAFTSWWTDASNRAITDLMGFTKTFFAKHALLNILTRYCIFDVDQKLLVMRPYQIVAAERILQRIVTAINHKKAGTLDAGGYVWHTTGSGKTLTSFKAAQLATALPEVDKVLFVVDRKDLDYQTMREYERFKKGAANSNTSTAVLKQQLEDPDARIIVTTIQKLSRFVAGNKKHPIYQQRVVVIFDECHRSQFGDMHEEITKNFKKYHIFGFTGTPIFAENAPNHGAFNLRTTEQAFGDKLHTYTIVDAIADKNVLPFRIDYINTIKVSEAVGNAQVSAIDTERALLAPERIEQIVAYVREHFDQKTRRSATYKVAERTLRGFNALFATASIDAAKRYYQEFRRQQESCTQAQRLKVGIIYSYAPNEDPEAGTLPEESVETDALDTSSRDFLEGAIADYNAMFGTSYDTSADKFENYYKDLSRRLKDRELDVVIVVNMFLTGFDATTLNTLWVDKNLQSHGLIQAFSRTNRILNSVKTYGNIVCFRDLEQQVNDALALFGNKDAKGIVLLKPYAEYYSEYEKLVSELQATYDPGERIDGEADKKAFVQLYGAILRLKNILVSFDDFSGNEILSQREQQDYQSTYLDIYAEIRSTQKSDRADINDDLIFEIELIKQVEINVDYILMLVQRYVASKGAGDHKEIRAAIDRAVGASPSLRNKKDLIEEFVDRVSITDTEHLDEEWQRFIRERRAAELDQIIADQHLKPEETRSFVARAFRDGEIPMTGTAITRILPPGGRFDPTAQYAAKKQSALDKLQVFFDRFFGLG